MDEILGNRRQIAQEMIAAFEDESLLGREHIAKVLGRTRERSALPALIKGLMSSDRSISLASAWALGRIGDPVAIAPLAEQLKSPDEQKRQFIAHVIGAMGDSSASTELGRLLNDLKPQIRLQALLSLTCIQGRGSVKILELSLRDADPIVRRATTQILRLVDPGRVWRRAMTYISALLAAALAGFLIWKLR